MKTLNLLLLCMVCAGGAYGQKVEFAGQLNTGLSRFVGESAVNVTSIHHSITPESSYSYTSNPYGNRFATSYGVSVLLQRVTRNNLLVGAQAGAESLRSRINISGVYETESTWNSASLEYKEATGKTVLKKDFINLHPYLGYRVSSGATDFDFSFGPEVGIGLKSMEKGEATTDDGSAYSTNRDGSNLEVDVRARVGLTAYHHHFGFSAAYAHGVTNYLRGFDGVNQKANAVVLRFGLLYRL